MRSDWCETRAESSKEIWLVEHDANTHCKQRRATCLDGRTPPQQPRVGVKIMKSELKPSDLPGISGVESAFLYLEVEDKPSGHQKYITSYEVWIRPLRPAPYAPGEQIAM